VLTLPPITLATNQVVKLDAFANVNFSNVQSYSVLSTVSRNPNNNVTNDNDSIVQDPNQPQFQQVTVTTAPTSVDNPGPGTYMYSYTITGTAPFVAGSAGSINSRGFTAMVITTS
jgi:hypothetical protein